jgi:hypothetical protein
MEKACERIGLKSVQIQMLCPTCSCRTLASNSGGGGGGGGGGSSSSSRGSAEKSSRSGAVDGLPKLN